MKFLPANYAYLNELKEELKDVTGINMSFNDVMAMIQHKYPVSLMVEQLTVKVVEKSEKLK